jgi:hypothetical protein
MERKQAARKLSLSRETVRELTDTELNRVGGAIPPWTPVVHTLPLNQCFPILYSQDTTCL